MDWDFVVSHWYTVAGVIGGLVAVAVTRPWRFWLTRRLCPQCKNVLPRWDRWGWRDGWSCSRCGCESGR